MRATLRFLFFMVVLLGVLAVVLLSATVYTYNRLTAETLIAELRFERTGEREYLARLRTGDGCTERVLPLHGEQWRVDAEFLKWKYWALLLGLDSQYRLDRLEGRYRTAAEQNSEAKLAHDIADDTAIDIVALAGSLGRFNFLLDATYGSSTYQDIDVSRVHYVYRTTTGIITRSEPLPPLPAAGEPLPVNIVRACGAEPSAWRRFTAWIDRGAVAALARIGG